MVNDCETCKHNDKNWDELPCDGCCTAHSGYEADAISRQAVKELYYKDGYIDFRKICELPPVNPQEPKTGYREYNDIYDHYLCGNCKTVVMDYDNFCPNCGFRMVEPQERSDKE